MEGHRDRHDNSRNRMGAFVTCTVDEKVRPKPRYSSISDEIFTSVEKVVQGRGQSEESDPRYKFSSFPENEILQQSDRKLSSRFD